MKDHPLLIGCLKGEQRGVVFQNQRANGLQEIKKAAKTRALFETTKIETENKFHLNLQCHLQHFISWKLEARGHCNLFSWGWCGNKSSPANKVVDSIIQTWKSIMQSKLRRQLKFSAIKKIEECFPRLQDIEVQPPPIVCN